MLATFNTHTLSKQKAKSLWVVEEVTLWLAGAWEAGGVLGGPNRCCLGFCLYSDILTCS